MHADKYSRKKRNWKFNIKSQEQFIEMSDACSSREIVLDKTLNHFKENSVICKFYNLSNTLGGQYNCGIQSYRFYCLSCKRKTSLHLVKEKPKGSFLVSYGQI